MRRLLITLHNALLFALLVCPRLPFWRWPQAWLDIQAAHRRQVERDVLALRLAGKVRRDAEGRLWRRE